MATQPTPGGDLDVWATELNEYLSVSLNSNGTIKQAAFDLLDNRGPSVSSYSSLTAAVAAIGATVTTLHIDSATTCTANTTIPSTLSIVVTKRGSINQGAYTLTISTGHFSAGLGKVFYGTGSVVFSSGSIIEAYPEWWGAIGDNSTDSTAAINAAITAISKGIVRLAWGTYLLTTPAIMKNGVSVHGCGALATILSQTGTGAVIKYQHNFSSTIFDSNLMDLRLSGKLTDTASGDGIFMETAYGINDCVFKNLWITKCGRSGIYSSQLSNPWWNQYLTFDNIFIGDIISSVDGCQSHAIYAEGGFSTNSFRNIRAHNNKKGIKITSGGGIIPESNVLDTCNIQNIENGANVVHGIELIDTWSTSIINPYIEGIGMGDPTKVSSAIYIYGYGNLNTIIQGGLMAGFWNGIYIDRAEHVSINGVTHSWSGSSPASDPIGFINIGSLVGNKTIKIGLNRLAGGSQPVTYVTGSIERAEGYFDKDTGAQRATYGLLTVERLAPTDILMPGAGAGGTRVLDDFEYGTWTPVLTAASPGNLAVTYTRNVGRYTKVGRTVTLQFEIVTSAFTHTTASNFVKITGIPYTCNVDISAGAGLGSWSGITKATYTSIGAYIGSGNAYMHFRANGSAVATADLQITDLPTGGSVVLRGSITYDV